MAAFTPQYRRSKLFEAIYNYLAKPIHEKIYLYYGDKDTFKRNKALRLELNVVKSHGNYTPRLRHKEQLLTLHNARVGYFQYELDKDTRENAWIVFRFKISELQEINEFLSVIENYKKEPYVIIDYFAIRYCDQLERQQGELQKVIEEDLAEFEAEIAPLGEGAKKIRLISHFERKPANRLAAIKLHGTKCKACKFDFKEIYGQNAQSFIEVHHLMPVSEFNGEQLVNPKTDLTVLCANCHRMIHKLSKVLNKILSVEDLKNIIMQHRP